MVSSICVRRSLSRFLRFLCFGCAFTAFASAGWLPLLAQGGDAAKKAAPAPDVIVFTNGDHLTGKLLREVSGTVTFHSDIAGDISVPWDKIKSIQSSQKFAVLEAGQKLNRKTADASVVQGTVAMEDQKIQVTGATAEAPKEIPVKNADYLIDEDTFGKEVRSQPGFFSGWTGTVTAGASLVQATQDSRTFTGSSTLVRAIPTVPWLVPNNRTIFDFNGAYGSVTEPGTTPTKTNIIHFDAQRDWYFRPSSYVLVEASFDHNYSQGLNLQMIYGGGLGHVFIKNPQSELDGTFTINYEQQSFGITPGVIPIPAPTPDTHLIGASVGDTYMRKLPRGMVFNQSLVVTPAFNDASAYSGIASVALSAPAFKRMSFTVGSLDNFLNDPAAGSKKNSFQFTAGVTYSLK